MTEFKAWRVNIGVTQQQAAELLGLSISQIKNLDSGKARGTDGISEPTLPVRMLMTAVAKGYRFKPWPEK